MNNQKKLTLKSGTWLVGNVEPSGRCTTNAAETATPSSCNYNNLAITTFLLFFIIPHNFVYLYIIFVHTSQFCTKAFVLEEISSELDSFGNIGSQYFFGRRCIETVVCNKKSLSAYYLFKNQFHSHA